LSLTKSELGIFAQNFGWGLWVKNPLTRPGGSMINMIKSAKGSMFDANVDALVNPVNCVGVMGGGLALQFKIKYPRMYSDYREACQRGRITTGQIHAWYDPQSNKTVINFPTKDHWRDPSELDYISMGLAALRERLTTDLCVIKSIAIPALGCGLGGLHWGDVKPLIANSLGDLDIRVELFEPQT
jgi:O-acetyl-ADP-ribose deacetylase (regulator of RNase III)